MKRLPWFKFYPSDFTAEVAHLTAEERGAFISLLASMWQNGGSVWNDDKDLRRITAVDVRRWPRVKARLLPLLIATEDDRLTHNLIVRELDKAASKRPIKRTTEAQQRSPIRGGAANKINGLLPLDTRYQIPEEEEVCANAHTSARDLQTAFDNWNKLADELDLPLASTLTDDRKRKLRARLKEHGLKGWDDALDNLTRMPFWTGSNDRRWSVTFDWMLSPSNFVKILDGACANSGLSQGHHAGRKEGGFLDDIFGKAEPPPPMIDITPKAKP